MSFQKNKYCVIKEAVPKDIATFVYNYFLKKTSCKNYLIKDIFLILQKNGVLGQINKFQHIFALFRYSYGNFINENFTYHGKNKLKLNPTYSYARIYKTGDVLHRHKDRFSCEISTTLNLGGDPWPIHLEAKKNVGIPDGKKYTASSNNKGISINLKPGDMLVYQGMVLEHWREEFQGDNCAQVFLHYNNQKSKDADKNIYDKRKHLGLPSWFKQ